MKNKRSSDQQRINGQRTTEVVPNIDSTFLP